MQPMAAQRGQHFLVLYPDILQTLIRCAAHPHLHPDLRHITNPEVMHLHKAHHQLNIYSETIAEIENTKLLIDQAAYKKLRIGWTPTF